MLAREHNQVEAHVKEVVEADNERHDLASLGQLASLVISDKLCEGPVVNRVGACDAGVDLDVCKHDDQHLVDDEVPREGNKGRVLVEGLLLDLISSDFAFSKTEQPEGSQVPAKTLEELGDHINDDDVHQP